MSWYSGSEYIMKYFMCSTWEPMWWLPWKKQTWERDYYRQGQTSRAPRQTISNAMFCSRRLMYPSLKHRAFSLASPPNPQLWKPQLNFRVSKNIFGWGWVRFEELLMQCLDLHYPLDTLNNIRSNPIILFY